MPLLDSQKFPSGRNVADCRKDAKRLAREQKIPLHEAQDRVAKLNGENLPWGLAIRRTQAASGTVLAGSKRIPLMTAADIERVIADNRRLTHFGMGVSSHGIKTLEEHHAALLKGRAQLLNAVDECNRACLFLAHVEKIKMLNPRAGSSYGLKHQVERFLRSRPGADNTDCYVANGSLICAAIFLGFDYQVESLESPNVHFNMGLRSPVFIWSKLKNRSSSSYYRPGESEKLKALEMQLGIAG